MKIKLPILAAMTLMAGSLFAAGPHLGLVIGFGGARMGSWGPSMVCLPPHDRRFPRLFNGARFASSLWYLYPTVGYSPGFRTISPPFYDSAPAVIRVPPPIPLTQPAVVQPSSPFRWRR